jgi:chemotaxis signal transduction protein
MKAQADFRSLDEDGRAHRARRVRAGIIVVAAGRRTTAFRVTRASKTSETNQECLSSAPGLIASLGADKTPARAGVLVSFYLPLTCYCRLITIAVPLLSPSES